jgi:anaerobic magnesium-protoporphyrin IX monomethyl ester cyclase
MNKVMFIGAVDNNSEVESRYPGLGMAYLVSSLRSHFGDSHFQFKIIEHGSEAEIKKQILLFRPDVVGISSVTQNFNYAKKYAALTKGEKIPVILGGVHISMLPQSLPKEADVACLGEGELTIIELMELFEKKKAFPKEDLININGVAFWDTNDNLVITQSRPLIENLNQIKMAARDLLKIEKHSYIFSSRGCPYRCTFCASSRFWDKVRLFSARYVANEIKELYENYDVRMISFFDDLFIINPTRLEEITDLLKEQNLLGKIKFTGSCRANLIDERVAKILKAMGVISVGLGLESGNERVLRYLKGETSSVEHNRNAVKILKKYGLSVNASFVIGSPDETEEEMMDTYNFIKNTPIDLVDIYVLTPMPGTPVWDYAKKHYFVSDDMDWSNLNVNFDINKEAVVLSELYDRDKLIKIYNKFRVLRLFKNIVNIWHSPFLMDLPRYLLKISYSKAESIFKNNN